MFVLMRFTTASTAADRPKRSELPYDDTLLPTHLLYHRVMALGRCGTSPTRKSRSLPSQTFSRSPIPAPGRLAPGPPAGRLWATAVVHPDHLSYLSCCARHTAVYGRRATHHVSPAPTIVSGHAAPIPASGGEPTHSWRDTHRQALTSGALRERHARRYPTCEHQGPCEHREKETSDRKRERRARRCTKRSWAVRAAAYRSAPCPIAW